MIAKDIPREGFFRKTQGRKVYKRISWSAIKFFLRGKHLNYVYGISANGNMTRVEKEVEVIQETPDNFIKQCRGHYEG